MTVVKPGLTGKQRIGGAIKAGTSGAETLPREEMVQLAGGRKSFTLALVVMIVLLGSLATPVRGQPLTLYIVWFLGFNTTLPPFDNVMMRQAVAAALDRPKLAASDSNSLAVGLEPAGCLAHNPEVRQHAYSPDRAKELLTQSGVDIADLGEMGIWYLSALRGRSVRRQELDLLLANISAIGLRPALREFGNYNAFARIATLEVVKMSYWGVVSASPLCGNETAFLEDLVYSKGDLNYFGYRNGEVDGLIDQARQARDRATKVRLFRQAEQKVLDDAVLVPVWLFTISS